MKNLFAIIFLFTSPSIADEYDSFAITDASQIELYYQNEIGENYGSIGAIKRMLEKHGKNLIFATNAGLYSQKYAPIGLYIQNGIKYSDIINGNGSGNFSLKPNGVFVISDDGTAHIIETQKFKANPITNIKHAIQSGPMLVIENEIHPKFNKNSSSKYIRNGVGICKDDKVILAISNKRVTFHQFASYFKDELKCENALYLDGSISRMYIKGSREKDLTGIHAAIFAVIE